MRDLILHQLDQFLRPKFLQPMPQIAQALNDGIDAFQMMNPCIENGSRVFPCTSLKTDPARRPQEVAWLVATFFRRDNSSHVRFLLLHRQRKVTHAVIHRFNSYISSR